MYGIESGIFFTVCKWDCNSAKEIVLLTNTVISPSIKGAIADLSAAYAGKVKHIQYDAVSLDSCILCTLSQALSPVT